MRVRGGVLEIGFTPKVEFPGIAAIEVIGENGIALKINCGGPKYGSYAADPVPGNGYAPVGDFYRDWARAEFGVRCGTEIGKLFEGLDGRLPRPVEWTDGPGGLRPDERPWKPVYPEYAFVDELAAFRGRVSGAGSLERLDYWLNTFRYMRATAKLRCVWTGLNRAIDASASAPDPQTRNRRTRDEAIPRMMELARALGEVYRFLLATVSTKGELGTVANWEQHIRPELLDKTGKRLEELLGAPLPADARPQTVYDGALKLIVLPSPSHMDLGEAVELKALVLSASSVQSVTLWWRPMGRGAYRSIRAEHKARGVYRFKLLSSLARGEDIEFHVKAVTADGHKAAWPPGSPALDQTVAVIPGMVKADTR